MGKNFAEDADELRVCSNTESLFYNNRSSHPISIMTDVRELLQVHPPLETQTGLGRTAKRIITWQQQCELKITMYLDVSLSVW